MRIPLRFLLLIILFSDATHAGMNEGTVEWLAQDATFIGVRQLEFHPAINRTGHEFDFDVAAAVTQALRDQFTKAGLVLISPGGAEPLRVVIKSSMEYFQPGTVGERWVGFGGGSAACILRIQLFDGQSNRQLADIIGAYQIQAGGLFTIGAEKTVPKSAAKLIADRILKLVGLKRVDDEMEGEDNEGD